MRTMTTGVIAAGFLAIGIAIGAAGTVVARDDAAPDMANHMRDMTSMMGAGSMEGMSSMMSMMGAGSMEGMSSMMSMMGAGSPMTPSASMGPGASMSTEEHESHHAPPSPATP